MKARIFKPAKTAMQSGTRRTRRWRLEYLAADAPGVDPLMGWTTSTDTRRQVHLDFPTKDEAIAYAERTGLEYRIEEEKVKNERTIAYADNFKSDRPAPWTH
ncbi:MAG: ETC complex I subunit [Devosia sp.]